MLNTKEILDRLKALREHMALRQEQVARLLGVDRTTYVRKERGLIPITTDEWLKLACAFDKEPAYFFASACEDAPAHRKDDTLDELIRTLSQDERQGLLVLLGPMLDDARRKRSDYVAPASKDD